MRTHTHKQRSGQAERRVARRQTNRKTNKQIKPSRHNQPENRKYCWMSEFRLWLCFSDIGFRMVRLFGYMIVCARVDGGLSTNTCAYWLTDWQRETDGGPRCAWIGNWKMKSVCLVQPPQQTKRCVRVYDIQTKWGVSQAIEFDDRVACQPNNFQKFNS